MSTDQIIELFGGNPALAMGGLIGGFVVFMFVLVIGVTALMSSRIKKTFGPDRELLENGTPGQAEILSIQQTGVYLNEQPQALLRLRVTIPGWDPYEAQTKIIIPLVNIPSFQPGATFPVKVDPNDRQNVMLDIYTPA